MKTETQIALKNLIFILAMFDIAGIVALGFIWLVNL